MVTFASGLATGVGFTVIVNCCVLPEQFTPALVYWGIIVMVPTKGFEELALVALNDEMFPLPLAANPIPTVLLAHA